MSAKADDVASVLARGEVIDLRAAPRYRPGPEPAPEPEQGDDVLLPTAFSEDALAAEFTADHRDDLLYVHEWGRWLRWDGTRWAPERTLAVYDLARSRARSTASAAADARIRARISNAATVAGIVRLARADRAHARVTEDFDRDPWLLNTPSGTVDLRTGTMRAHHRGDLITQSTPVSPVDAEPVLWLACLRTWTRGDADLEGFLRRLIGYTLTGSTREERLPIFYGPGGNGKSKFVETARACLGADYATSITMESLIVTTGDQHPTDLADLRGKRLALANETEEGRRLAESKIKSLTGGDRVRARYMRRDFFEFTPTHKLIIVGNHKPALRNVDEAMRRRLLLVPFTAEIAPDQRDPNLSAKLVAELPAILGWAIRGAAEWYRDGLLPPASVLAATEDYFATADALGRWSEDRLLFDPNATATKADTFADWKAWAEHNGEFVGKQERLREYLLRLPGVDEARLGKGVRAWIGLGLRQG